MKYNISFGNYKYNSVIYMAQNRITPPRLSLYPHRSMSNCYTKNIKQYENMIIKINYLLDKLTILKTHPMILYHDYGY